MTREAESNPEGAGFLTLTLGDWKDGKWVGVSDISEVGARWNSVRRHLIEWLKIEKMICVPEKHASGNWHLHVFVSSRDRIRRNYVRGKRACKVIQGHWATLRRKLPGFGFGRHQWEPVLSVRGCGRYLGKYLGKGMECNEPGERKIRLVRYCGDWTGRMMSKGWSWVTKGGDVHRRVVRAFGVAWGVTSGTDWQSRFKEIFGPKWCAVFWGWWMKCKKRGWSVLEALRWGEYEGIFPPGAANCGSTITAAAVAFLAGELKPGKCTGTVPFRVWECGDISQW